MDVTGLGALICPVANSADAFGCRYEPPVPLVVPELASWQP